MDPSSPKSDWLPLSLYSITESNVDPCEYRKRSPIQQTPDCQTNYPCQSHRKYKEDREENKNITVRVKEKGKKAHRPLRRKAVKTSFDNRTKVTYIKTISGCNHYG